VFALANSEFEGGELCSHYLLFCALVIVDGAVDLCRLFKGADYQKWHFCSVFMATP
jgi:hypothetical protein